MKNLSQATLLFLEDNQQYAKDTINLLSLYFGSIIHCSSIKAALHCWQKQHVDAIISDLKVDDGNALEFIAGVRREDTATPIVVLSAHNDERFLLRAVELGLSKYLIKPLDFKAFESMLHILDEKIAAAACTVCALGPTLRYDFDKKMLESKEKKIALTKKEILFFELLLENKNAVVSKERVLQHVYNRQEKSDSALKNLVLRLRKKLDTDVIKTVSGVGYTLKD
ncbi:MAG: response regulator transcription factor [Campylobacterota bacterium]